MCLKTVRRPLWCEIREWVGEKSLLFKEEKKNELPKAVSGLQERIRCLEKEVVMLSSRPAIWEGKAMSPRPGVIM